MKRQCSEKQQIHTKKEQHQSRALERSIAEITEGIVLILQVYNFTVGRDVVQNT